MGKKEEVLDLLSDFATAIEAAAIDLKQQISKIVKVAPLTENSFLGLTWEKRKGAKLKEFEFTTKTANNDSDVFNHCFKVLKANQATINNRFHCEGWQYSYWLYVNRPGTIYRQLLKPNA